MTIKEIPPHRALVDMAQGFFRGKTLCAAVRLGIADELADREKHVDELAVATASDRDALYRLLRALASIGVLAETSPAFFALTPLGQPLRRDHPQSVWASMIFWSDLLADMWTFLPECVRAGETGGAAAAMDGAGVKSRWSQEPDPMAIFHAVFAEPSAEDMASIASSYDFSRSSLVADLGGAGGGLLAAILAANPETRGLLVDRQEAMAGAASRLSAAGLTDRCQVLGADLMEQVPAGADVYILKAVLHGYSDDDARRILGHCHAGMSTVSRLLIIEVVLPERIDQPDPSLERLLLADLNMLAATGGRERSATDWERLLLAADFEMLQVMPIPNQDVSLIEATRRTSSGGT